VPLYFLKTADNRGGAPVGCRHLRQLKKQAAFCRKPPR